MSRLTKKIAVMAMTLLGSCIACAATTSGATASVAPTTGISASGISSSSCPSSLWSCLDDSIGYPDGDTSNVYTTSSSASHVIGFTESYSQITSVTMHIVAASHSGGPGTVTMSFYNGSVLGGTGSAKTISAGSGYTEYVSGVFYTSVSSLSDITMKIALTGDVKYTAAWLDVTYGGSGTTPSSNLAQYMVETNTGDSFPGTQWYPGSCTTGACAGGAGITGVSVSTGVSVPSSGPYSTGTKVVTSTTDTTIGHTDSALEWVKLGSASTGPSVPSSLNSLTADWWVYPTAESTSNPRTLEFDSFWGHGSGMAMWGSHCSLHDSNPNGQVWYLDAQDGVGWVPAYNSQTGTTIPCNLTANQWHHVTWQVHIDTSAGGGGTTGKIFYDYLTVDGTTYNLSYGSKVHGIKSSTWTVLGIQVQQDLNAESSPASVTEYVASMYFTYW
jgi:hypothetical protein